MRLHIVEMGMEMEMGIEMGMVRIRVLIMSD